MLHVPVANRVTVAVLTVQTDRVVEAKLTASPELAVAPTVNGALPYVWAESAEKVMVCGAGVTAKVCVFVAGDQPLLPS